MADRSVILIVLDGVGIGALPDADRFGDVGAHTLGNIYKELGRLNLENLYAMGLAGIEASRLPRFGGSVRGAFGRAAELSNAKDTVCGHWEMMGIVSANGFKTYPNGFPAKLISGFERVTGAKPLGNCVASGTEIISRLGDEHVRTAGPIVYTSADSVFQIAAHESVIPPNALYDICIKTRRLLDEGGYDVCRVIARPFAGESGGYFRTENRKDFAVEPQGETVLDALLERGYKTAGVGKIEDIFAGRGLTAIDHTRNNSDGIDATLRFMRTAEYSLIFTNLVDFDMLYGHRNDIQGFAEALEAFDARLPEITAAMRADDLLIITADHGCDPAFPTTDHTREYVPVLIYTKAMRGPIDLGTINGFSFIGETALRFIEKGKEGLPFCV